MGIEAVDESVQMLSSLKLEGRSLKLVKRLREADLRCVINDAYFRKSKKEKFETPPSANVPAVACIKVTILQVVMASILHLWKEKNSEVHIIKILRGINRVKNCHWATCRGLKAGMEALMKEGLANSDGLIAVGELAD
jgi:hypothetical protein